VTSFSFSDRTYELHLMRLHRLWLHFNSNTCYIQGEIKGVHLSVKPFNRETGRNPKERKEKIMEFTSICEIMAGNPMRLRTKWKA